MDAVRGPSFPVSQASTSAARQSGALALNTAVSTSHNGKYNYNHDYDDDDGDEDDLPFPAELPRADFLSDEFDAQAYLSSLRSRHQTLEDLRSDLRARSQLLSRELLELVNGQYEAFLSLGDDLNGGEERVESVRVGLLGFEREVHAIWQAVKDRETAVGELLDERKQIMKDEMLGRALLEAAERIEELESRMGLKQKDDAAEDDADEPDDVDSNDEYDVDGDTAVEGAAATAQIARLRRHIRDYILIARLFERIGPSHPFLLTLRPRLDELRKTLLLDLGTALRQAKADKASNATLDIVTLYGDIGAESDGVRVLKSS